MKSKFCFCSTLKASQSQLVRSVHAHCTTNYIRCLLLIVVVSGIVSSGVWTLVKFTFYLSSNVLQRGISRLVANINPCWLRLPAVFQINRH